MKHRLTRAITVLAACAVIAAGCGSGSASPSTGASGVPSAAPTKSGVTASVAPTQQQNEPLISTPAKIPAPSLVGNLLGDPAQLDVTVLLPADYNTSGKRYPTVYFLTGFTVPVGAVLGYFGTSVQEPGSGVKNMIVVGVSGANALYGSFYRNSPVTGNWEDAIVKDLVGYVDGRYRTIPAAASRGIAGHSMGGYGAWNLAMNHPDVFGAVGVITPGFVSDRGMVSTQMFSDESTIREELATLAELSAMSDADARAKFVEKALAGNPDAEFALAYGAAVVPDPTSRTLMRFPYTETGGKLVADPEVMKLWNDGFGNQKEKVAQHKADLAAFRGIQIEYATGDEYAWIPEGCVYVDKVLTEAGISHKTIAFEGSHDPQVPERVQTSLMPFFSKALEG